MSFTIRSTAFSDGGEIPSLHTCEGADTSPPLEFGGVPEGARSLALVVDDPDAPDPKAPRMVFVHWVLYDIPSTTPGLKEGISPKELPRGTRVGQNDYRRPGYGGPCPPVGRHRYFFKLYALDAVLGDLGGVTKTRLLRIMEGHVLALAELVGTYEKRRGR
jgi:Raf kinase inhibitor-like YbhB/YbcL family protein